MKNHIFIEADALDDLIWMSYRYCIGRHTIASHYHARTIENLISENKELLSDRIPTYIKDIQESVDRIKSFNPDDSDVGVWEELVNKLKNGDY